jgi:hypothetical protein
MSVQCYPSYKNAVLDPRDAGASALAPTLERWSVGASERHARGADPPPALSNAPSVCLRGPVNSPPVSGTNRIVRDSAVRSSRRPDSCVGRPNKNDGR